MVAASLGNRSRTSALEELSRRSFDVLVIGAGPTGLACAIEAQRAGFKVIAIDKGCVVNSIFNYPANMTFFTTPELLEIGDIPFSTANQKPTRQEALEYYRKVAEHYHLPIAQYQWVKTVNGKDGDFQVATIDRLGRIYDYQTRKLIAAISPHRAPQIGPTSPNPPDWLTKLQI